MLKGCRRLTSAKAVFNLSTRSANMRLFLRSAKLTGKNQVAPGCWKRRYSVISCIQASRTMRFVPHRILPRWTATASPLLISPFLYRRFRIIKQGFDGVTACFALPNSPFLIKSDGGNLHIDNIPQTDPAAVIDEVGQVSKTAAPPK